MDVNGGQLTQTNGNPIFPGTAFTGPLLAGNIQHTDGSGLGGLGDSTGTANVGYALMVQAMPVTQASGATTIVIPAQSQIIGIYLMVTTAWTGVATTMGIGTTASATALTAAAAVQGSTLGLVTVTPGTGATQIGNWDNVGSTDIQIAVTSTNTGSGVGTLTVLYAQGINQAS